MNRGMPLAGLASELERRLSTRYDYVAPATVLHAVPMEDNIGLSADGAKGGAMPLVPWARAQLAEGVKIPRVYFDRMVTENPALAAINVNAWLPALSPRLVRTLDGEVRAVLSNAFRPLDNYDLTMALLPALKSLKAEIVSCSLTETRLYLKATAPSMEMRVTNSRSARDLLRGGIVISNSEVGNGALAISFFVERLVCVNGMIADSVLRKAHLGRRRDDFTEAVELYTDHTRRLDDAAFWSKVRDVVRATFNESYLKAIVEKADCAAKDELPAARVEGVVEVVLSRWNLPDSSGPRMLTNLIESNDLSRWGVVNAVTVLGNDESNYEQATEFERIGGKILDLGSSDWRELVNEAA